MDWIGLNGIYTDIHQGDIVEFSLRYVSNIPIATNISLNFGLKGDD